MVIYTVHEPKAHASSLTERAENIVFVKEGFSWWGFLLPPIWMIANRLWFELLGFVLVSAALGAGLSQLGLREQAAGIISIFLGVLIGFEGNNLKRWRLERKGYTLLASVVGHTADECEQRFFTAWLPYAAAQSSGTATPPASGSPLSGGGKANPADMTNWRGSTVIGTLSEA